MTHYLAVQATTPYWAVLGHDLITDSSGADTLLGGDGNDTIYGLTLADSILGGAGNDSFKRRFWQWTICSAAVVTTQSLAAPAPASIPSLVGSGTIALPADRIPIRFWVAMATIRSMPAPAPVLFSGGSGTDSPYRRHRKRQFSLAALVDDTIDGGRGNDTVEGGLGSDKYVLNSGDGNDVPYSNRGGSRSGGASIGSPWAAYTTYLFPLVAMIWSLALPWTVVTP